MKTHRKMVPVGFLVSVLWLGTMLSSSGAAQASGNWVPVKADGITTLSVVASGNVRATVTIETHTLDIGNPSDPMPDKPATNCTYSRYPCSLVDRFDFSVNGGSVFTARSVFADLSDIDVASLSADGSIFILRLQCGDASEAYNVMIKFNHLQVLERTLSDGGTGHIFQATKYFPPETVN